MINSGREWDWMDDKPMTDSDGNVINIGDKVRGEGTLDCNGGFKIDLTPVVTVREKGGKIYFGGLSYSSFRRFWKVNNEKKETIYKF